MVVCFSVEWWGGKNFRAPLILYPVNLEQNGGAVEVSLEHQLYRINYSLLDVLDNKQAIESGVTAAMQITGGVLSGVVVSAIAEVFKLNMPEVDVSSLIMWPRVRGLSGVHGKIGDGLKLLPVAGWGVLKRSSGSSGVVDELERLGSESAGDWSSALGAMFDGGETREAENKPILAPVLLSDTQEHLVKSARSNDLTVCHGPPGTGKSFTLAAIAVDHIARGETVLVVSKKDHAVDVLRQKAVELLGSTEAIVRGGRNNHLKKFKDRVSRVLARRYSADVEHRHHLHEVTMSLLDVLSDIMDATEQLDSEYEKSILRGEVSAKPDPSWYERIKKLWYEGKVRKRPLLAELSVQLDKLYGKKDKIVKRLIRAQQNYLVNKVMTETSSRADMKKLQTALKKRRSSEQYSAFMAADFDSILKVYPIWMTSLSDLHRVLPLKKAMFDVVIIDEASQCDIASALPAIHRAKRVVIAGDEKQLRHVSFISHAGMKKFARDLGLSDEDQEVYDYRNVSLMDLAISNVRAASQVAMLCEHFRSLKSIIRFSNTEFYQGSLRLMRDRPWEADDGSSLEFRYCDGVRSDVGVNEAEIDAVLNDLARFMGKRWRGSLNYKSIGILSPFRAQVDALTAAVSAYAQEHSCESLVVKHGVRVGTAHSFQGEERDIMLISLAYGRTDNSGSRRFLEQEDVFNVSITRARHEQIVYHSVHGHELPATSLLGQYLLSEGCGESGMVLRDFAAEVDQFGKEFVQAFELRGIRCRFNQSVASIAVDVLLEENGRCMGVDLVGYPGYTRDAVGINRHQILERAGFKIVPVGYVEWQVQREHVIKEVLQLLKKS